MKLERYNSLRASYLNKYFHVSTFGVPNREADVNDLARRSQVLQNLQNEIANDVNNLNKRIQYLQKLKKEEKEK